jgi:hypothetical protein
MLTALIALILGYAIRYFGIDAKLWELVKTNFHAK